MVRPKKSEQKYSANEGLLLFMLANDALEYLEDPKAWIAHSHMLSFRKRIDKKKRFKSIKSIKKSSIANEQKVVEMSEANSQAAQAKANETAMFKLWAITFYINKRLQKKIASKEYWSRIIYRKLAEDFPDYCVSEGEIAQTGQIPNKFTIKTQWLRKI